MPLKCRLFCAASFALAHDLWRRYIKHTITYVYLGIRPALC